MPKFKEQNVYLVRFVNDAGFDEECHVVARNAMEAVPLAKAYLEEYNGGIVHDIKLLQLVVEEAVTVCAN